jgi:hypothetical protein
METGFEVYILPRIYNAMFEKKLAEYNDTSGLQWKGGQYSPSTLHELIQSWGCPEGVKSVVRIIFYDEEDSLRWLKEPVRI